MLGLFDKKQSASAAEPATPGTEPEGILIVDKPYGWSSHDVVAVVRRIFGVKRVGHAGTLDPLATGVLIVLVGRGATKLQDTYMSGAKEYIADIVFGVVSETDDAEGPLALSCKQEVLGALTTEQISAVLPTFLGTTEQKAPAYSAIQVNGKRLYQAARAGTLDDATIPTRTITIDAISEIKNEGVQAEVNEDAVETQLDILNGFVSDHDDNTGKKTFPSREERDLIARARFDASQELEQLLPHTQLRIQCQKGTYIRALARDIGAQLGTGAFLSGLKRTRVGAFTIDQAVSIEDIKNGTATLLPIK